MISFHAQNGRMSVKDKKLMKRVCDFTWPVCPDYADYECMTDVDCSAFNYGGTPSHIGVNNTACVFLKIVNGTAHYAGSCNGMLYYVQLSCGTCAAIAVNTNTQTTLLQGAAPLVSTYSGMRATITGSDFTINVITGSCTYGSDYGCYHPQPYGIERFNSDSMAISYDLTLTVQAPYFFADRYSGAVVTATSTRQGNVLTPAAGVSIPVSFGPIYAELDLIVLEPRGVVYIDTSDPAIYKKTCPGGWDYSTEPNSIVDVWPGLYRGNMGFMSYASAQETSCGVPRSSYAASFTQNGEYNPLINIQNSIICPNKNSEISGYNNIGYSYGRQFIDITYEFWDNYDLIYSFTIPAGLYTNTLTLEVAASVL